MTKERRLEHLLNAPPSSADNMPSALWKDFHLSRARLGMPSHNESSQCRGTLSERNFHKSEVRPPVWCLLSKEEFKDHLCALNFCGTSSRE